MAISICNVVTSVGGSKGVLKSGTFLLHGVLSVALDPVSP